MNFITAYIKISISVRFLLSHTGPSLDTFFTDFSHVAFSVILD